MRIKLSEFKLPGEPGIPGSVVYTSIAFDINSGQDAFNEFTPSYFVCGYREDDGAGVLIHGTKDDDPLNSYTWRKPRLISAPSDQENGVTVQSTEFQFIEPLPAPNIRLVGAVKTAERGEKRLGFLYEGWLDGSGDWYPIEIPDEEETVVKGCGDGILVCSAEDGTDAVHVYSLEKQKWAKLHCGYADKWEVDEVIHAGDIYVLRLLHADGKRSDISYTEK